MSDSTTRITETVHGKEHVALGRKERVVTKFLHLGKVKNSKERELRL